MLALIMAGGLGTRMNLGEKPLLTIGKRPMLSYVISAFEDAGFDILVVVTKKVPMTKNWCRANGIEIYQSEGIGYVEDLINCITDIGEEAPFFSCVSDIPGITPQIINKISGIYDNSGMQACSVWVPQALFNENNCKCNYHEKINDIVCCPVGLNILDGADICNEQEELKVLLNEPALTFNVNTQEELKRAEIYFKTIFS
ncbi:MAG: NTP transferase domain-containing protein [Methanomicrobium sp.]|nr:NTP transferase domain-containing protein [Methanomicrobium sp.]